MSCQLGSSEGEKKLGNSLEQEGGTSHLGPVHRWHCQRWVGVAGAEYSVLHPTVPSFAPTCPALVLGNQPCTLGCSALVLSTGSVVLGCPGS